MKFQVFRKQVVIYTVEARQTLIANKQEHVRLKNINFVLIFPLLWSI